MRVITTLMLLSIVSSLLLQPHAAGAGNTGDTHLANILRLTSVPGAQNAEAYFSFDGKKLSFQSTRPPFKCDQIFTMDLGGANVRLASTGKGRTTCSYFLPGDMRILFASTHEGGPDCPAPPDMSHGYMWAVYKDYDLYTARPDGGDLRPLTRSPGYDAEATVSPDGKHIVWTSQRDGDLDLYTMNLDGSGVKRMTTELGYDGGGFYSWDSSRIVFRAYHPKERQDVERYRSLLAQGLVEGKTLEIMVMNADGTGTRQITRNGKVNFAPSFHPNGKQIIFSSNAGDPSGRSFQLYLVNEDGTGLEQVTSDGTFNSFPMFNREGTKLAFSSNGYGSKPGEINIFVADWK